MKKLSIWIALSCLLLACSEDKIDVPDVPGDTCKPRCENGKMQYCNGSVSNCSYGCNAEQTGCADSPQQCTPGCRNGVLTTCNGNVASTQNCPGGTCNNAGTACENSGSCTPGCVNGVLTTCNGNVSSTSNCPSGTCNATGTDCETSGECVPGCKFAKMTTCNGGVASVVSCPSGACMQDGSACAPVTSTCTPSCRNGKATVCNGGVASEENCVTGACNAQGTGCKLGVTTKCNGNILHVSDSTLGFSREFDYNCADYGQTCSTVDGLDDCRETCLTAGDTKTQCNQGSLAGSYTLDFVCTQGLDGNKYWNRNDSSEKGCNSGESCNETFTACMQAETCNPANYQASCTNNVARICTAFQTVQIANCTQVGKTCAKTSSTKAECIDNDMVCSRVGDKKNKCGISETTQHPVSILYTCTQAADGNNYFLNGVNDACGNYGCDSSTGKCVIIDDEEDQTCDPGTYFEHCNGTRAIYCSKTNRKVTALECNDDKDPGYVCLTVQNSVKDTYVDCFSAEKDSCTSEGATKTAAGSFGTYTFECSRASDGNLYWAEIGFVESN